MGCQHVWRRQPPVKGGSGLEVSVCLSCDERRMDGEMGSPASYLSPRLFDRLGTERPDLYERWVSAPLQGRSERRAAIRRTMNGNGRG